MKILVTGAAGAGTSTLGRALAREIGASFIEGDEHFWFVTDPPYQRQRSPEERLASLVRAVNAVPSVVVAGSIAGWGAEIESGFSLVVFLSVPTDVRVARLRARETARFGRPHEGFIEWAAQYEEGRLEGRSRAIHERWLSERACQVLRIEGDLPVEECLRRALGALAAGQQGERKA